MSVFLPHVFAGDTNFSSGPDTGTPTKVDPGEAITEQGLIPGGPLAAQHFNFVQNKHSVASRRSRLVHAIMQRYGTPINAATTLPASVGVVAISTGFGVDNNKTICVKGGTNGVFFVFPGESMIDIETTAGSLTTATGIARVPSGGRIVVVGATSPFNAFSTDFGNTWTDGAALGSAPISVVYSESNSLFVAQLASGSTQRSADATSWNAAVLTGLSTGGSAAFSGLGVLSNGNIITGGRNSTATDLNFAVSTDGGVSFSAMGNVANSATIAGLGAGFVVGNGGDAVYHIGRIISGQFQISMCTDSATWTTVATLSTPFSLLTQDPQLRICEDTGLMVINTTVAAGLGFVWVSTDGANWEGPVPVSPTPSLAVAGGRLIRSHDAAGVVSISDGIGYDG